MNPLVDIPLADMKKFERITFDPKIMGARACIRGMRIPVSVIVGQIAHGGTPDEILADYPDLEQDDIREALEYTALLIKTPHLNELAGLLSGRGNTDALKRSYRAHLEGKYR